MLFLLNVLSKGLKTFFNVSGPFVDMHIVGHGGSNYFPLSCSGSKRMMDVKGFSCI
jgi:hypothetical protein